MGFYRDMALDLGTATVQGAVSGQGVVLREPSLAAADRQTGQVLAMGQAARELLDRTPGGYTALRPIQHGAVADSGVVQAMLHTFWKKGLGRGLGKPRLLLSVPTGISPVEERALLEAALQAGAGKVFLMEAPLAAALGAGLEVEGPKGQLVVTIGAGVTDGAVLAMGRVMASVCIPAAGDKLEEALIQAVRRDHGLVLGRQTSRTIKETLGPEGAMTVKGQCLTTGLPQEMDLTAAQAANAFQPVVNEITSAIQTLLEKTPPELVQDVKEGGILLTGGGSLLPGLAEAIAQAVGIPARVAPEPELCVIQGLEATLPHLNRRKDGPLDLAKQR